MSSEGDKDEVHPIELTVQSLLETPLEVLNLNLKSLHESQMILHAILFRMENTLKDSANNLRSGSFATEDQIVGSFSALDEEAAANDARGKGDVDSGSEEGVRIDHSDVEEEVDLKEYLRKLVAIRKKMRSIEKIMDVVEARVGKMELGMEQG